MDLNIAQDMSFLTLVIQASWVVKGVLLLLLFASVLSWWLIFEKYFTLRRELRAAEEFERDFWGGGTMPSSSGRMARTGAPAWRRCSAPVGGSSA